jgi:putative nucleotide binding protein
MSFGVTPTKRYEEYAYVLDFIPQGKSAVIQGRGGPIIQALGEERLTLLEILAMNNVDFEIGERICIGKDNRSKVISVLGRLSYEELTSEGKSNIIAVVGKMIAENEKRFVIYFNELQPVTPRLHALELIPGIGKTFMRQILNERDRKPFESFEEIQKRVGLREPIKLIARRIVEEISGGSRINLFVRK